MIVVVDHDREANAVRGRPRGTRGRYAFVDDKLLDLERKVKVYLNGTDPSSSLVRRDYGTLTPLHYTANRR